MQKNNCFFLSCKYREIINRLVLQNAVDKKKKNCYKYNKRIKQIYRYVYYCVLKSSIKKDEIIRRL